VEIPLSSEQQEIVSHSPADIHIESIIFNPNFCILSTALLHAATTEEQPERSWFTTLPGKTTAALTAQMYHTPHTCVSE